MQYTAQAQLTMRILKGVYENNLKHEIVKYSK